MQTKKQGGSRFLRTVEWLGNALPHPVILFIILIAILLVSSAVGEYSVLRYKIPDQKAPKDAQKMAISILLVC